MASRSVRKTPGWTWIEINNETHRFRVGDKSHPQSKEIYETLKVLIEKLESAGYVPDTNFVLHDIDEELKAGFLYTHSEKLAIAFGDTNIIPDRPHPSGKHHFCQRRAADSTPLQAFECVIAISAFGNAIYGTDERAQLTAFTDVATSRTIEAGVASSLCGRMMFRRKSSLATQDELRTKEAGSGRAIDPGMSASSSRKHSVSGPTAL
ncbi:No apical meristem (NAM) protein [Musa troglodytarum]|uniref:No apical meristem (NAM) protein n=1 Tax=Musa troglodytarum TaxID=320322 RepID=A0A9E7HBH6_9LILI|nr:No apical meristem (NAM) protein [Musa troglodytarum]